MPKCDFNKVAKQLYWNCTSALVFFCKFAAYFQNTFSQKHLWRGASFWSCSMKQRRSQNLKQAPQNFVKVFNVDYVILTSQLMTSHNKFNISSENYRVTSPSNHCCQISIMIGERPGILVTIHCHLSLRKKRVHIYVFLH